jgi:hypothetical protein
MLGRRRERRRGGSEEGVERVIELCRYFLEVKYHLY